ncbi:MAG: cation transporter [Oscillospiraceae bacterium]|nr:cation transporter [Oscillospiraceae bacterium]
MKKTFICILSCAILLTLTACGEKEPSDTSTTNPTTAPITTSGETSDIADTTDTSETTDTADTSDIITTVMTVSGMTCQKCVNAIGGEVGAMDGVIQVTLVLETGELTVAHTSQVTPDDIREVVVLEGYTVED